MIWGLVNHSLNPTFEDTSGVNVNLDVANLNPGKHSVVTFKENTNLNKNGVSGEADFSTKEVKYFFSKNKIGKKLNKTIRYRRDRFKLPRNTSISLF